MQPPLINGENLTNENGMGALNILYFEVIWFYKIIPKIDMKHFHLSNVS
jgi:hypothetical protein